MAMGQTIMSHMHHIDGLSTAAAQYQAYLERMRTAHADEEDKKVRRKNEGQKFQEHLNSEEEETPEGNPDQNPQGDGEQGTEPEAAPGDGFGNHYA
jgi:hypothetical protein